MAHAPLAPDDPRHGTANGYGNLGCRCDACRTANTAAVREHGWGSYRPSACPSCGGPKWAAATVCARCYRAALPPVVHGTTTMAKRCRCDLCRAESARVRREWRERNRERQRAYDRDRKRRERAPSTGVSTAVESSDFLGACPRCGDDANLSSGRCPSCGARLTVAA